MQHRERETEREKERERGGERGEREGERGREREVKMRVHGIRLTWSFLMIVIIAHQVGRGIYYVCTLVVFLLCIMS